MCININVHGKKDRRAMQFKMIICSSLYVRMNSQNILCNGCTEYNLLKEVIQRHTSNKKSGLYFLTRHRRKKRKVAVKAFMENGIRAEPLQRFIHSSPF